MKIYLLFILCFLFLISCKSYQSEYESELQKVQLIAEQISILEEEKKLIEGTYETLISSINEVNDTLDQMARNNAEIDRLIKLQKINANLPMGFELKQKISTLKIENERSKNYLNRKMAQVRQQKVLNAELKRMMNQLNVRWTKDSSGMDSLSNVLSTLNVSMNQMRDSLNASGSELADAYASLKLQNDKLSRQNKLLSDHLESLKLKTQFINDDAQGIIICKTRQELKKLNILKVLGRKTLHSDYIEAVLQYGKAFDYFNEDNVNCSQKTIDIILPYRPADTYEILNNSIKIKDRKLFWANSKILILVLNS